MKCMVLEADMPDDMCTPSADREFLMTEKEPPKGWQIWIAHINASDKWRTGFSHHSATLGTAPKGQKHMPPGNSLAKNAQTITIGFGRCFGSRPQHHPSWH